MTRPEWLASLKVGDLVGVTSRRRREVMTVTKITPSRRVTVDDRLTFDAQGSQYPRPGGCGVSYSFGPVDADFTAKAEWDEAERERVRLIGELRDFTSINAPKGFDHTTHNTALQAVLDALRSKP